jgi:hypothetical protein
MAFPPTPRVAVALDRPSEERHRLHDGEWSRQSVARASHRRGVGVVSRLTSTEEMATRATIAAMSAAGARSTCTSPWRFLSAVC